MNSLLSGHDADEHIVAVHQLNDSAVRIYKRHGSTVVAEEAEFFPFFFLSDAFLLQGFPTFHWLKELSGNHFFKFLAVFKRWGEMWEAVNFILREYNKNRRPLASSYADVDSLLLRPDPVYQYLIQSGKTSFKGLSFTDLGRLQVDIQVSARERRNTESKNQGQIILISMADSTGWTRQLDGRKLEEKSILESFIASVRERDPDIIEGHELFGFLLPYFLRRCELYSVDPCLGREGMSVRSYQRRFSPESEFTIYECPGRHFVDTSQLIRAYDYTKRSLENYELPQLAEHFGIARGPAVPRSKISSMWEQSPEIVLQHSQENVHVVEQVSALLSPSNFYLSQICPFNYATLTGLGSAARLESLMVREYLRQKHSIPQPQKGAQTVGGYTEIFVSGVLENVLQADAESLYPSIILSNNLKPRVDNLDVFVPLLREITAMRLEVKSKMRRSRSKSARSKYDALQSALKILGNSFYGYLAYGRGLFNDYQQADAVTTTGQSILRSVIRQMELFNAEPIEVDTDGIFFLPPDNVRGKSQEEAFVDRISTTLPDGINLVLASRSKKMLSYKMKNYALLDYRNELVIKGSSLISRSLERFARRYIRRCIECLLTEDVSQLHHTYASCYTQIKKHEWDVADFCRTETVHEDLDSYSKSVEAGRRHPTAAYEAAKKAGFYFKAGDRISYYVTGTQADVKVTDNCRIADEWDPNLPDENTEYYLARLEEYSNRFRQFFQPEDFSRIFSLDDLFGFSPKGITVVTKKMSREEVEVEPVEPGESEDFGIWLGEKG
ncbi:MAG: DNA polymerase [Ignavibacteriales bacterium]|nr:DNA polymerase [Ignavibacteriales bacterium]